MSGGSGRVLLPRNLDSVEFCPFPGLQSLLAVGTYTLKPSVQGQSSAGASHRADESSSSDGIAAVPVGEGSAERLGSVELFRMIQIESPSNEAPAQLRLHHLLSQDSAAVLDLKWAPPGTATSLASEPLLAQAGADGRVVVYRASCAPDWEESDVSERNASGAPAVNLSTWATAAASSPSDTGSLPLCLALDWSPSGLGPPWRIGVSRSDGLLSTLEVREGKGLVLEKEWEAHGFEAWTCTFDRWRPQVMYSGGDDCCFLGWDLRTDLCSPAFRNRKSHGAGVTSMQCSPLREHLLATGSYDEGLRLWDVRMVSRPLESCHVAVGGGVWRIKWHETAPCAVVVAGMHGGLAMVHVGVGVGVPQVDSLLGHGSTHNSDSASSAQKEEVEPDAAGRETEAEAEGSSACCSPEVATVTQHFMESDKALVYGADWWVRPEERAPLEESVPSDEGNCPLERGKERTCRGSGKSNGGDCLLMRKKDFTAVGCSFYERSLEICRMTRSID